MKKCILVFFSCWLATCANGQKIQFKSISHNYRLTDTIELKIGNYSRNDLFYFISAEEKVDGGMEEIC